MKYKMIIPEFIYMIILFGGIAISLISLFMGIRGIIKKTERQYFIKWSIILLLALVAVALTRTGLIVANTMIGG